MSSNLTDARKKSGGGLLHGSKTKKHRNPVLRNAIISRLVEMAGPRKGKYFLDPVTQHVYRKRVDDEYECAIRNHLGRNGPVDVSCQKSLLGRHDHRWLSEQELARGGVNLCDLYLRKVFANRLGPREAGQFLFRRFFSSNPEYFRNYFNQMLVELEICYKTRELCPGGGPVLNGVREEMAEWMKERGEEVGFVEADQEIIEKWQAVIDGFDCRVQICGYLNSFLESKILDRPNSSSPSEFAFKSGSTNLSEIQTTNERENQAILKETPTQASTNISDSLCGPGDCDLLDQMTVGEKKIVDGWRITRSPPYPIELHDFGSTVVGGKTVCSMHITFPESCSQSRKWLSESLKLISKYESDEEVTDCCFLPAEQFCVRVFALGIKRLGEPLGLYIRAWKGIEIEQL